MRIVQTPATDVNGIGLKSSAATLDRIASAPRQTDYIDGQATFTPPTTKYFKVGNDELKTLSPVVGPTAYAVYQCLRSHANAKMQCFPSLTTIAAKTGVCRMTVIRCTEVLETARVIRVKRDNPRDQSNDYTLLHPSLWQLDSLNTPRTRRLAKEKKVTTGSHKKVISVVTKSDTNKTPLEQNLIEQHAPAAPIVANSLESPTPATATKSLISEIIAIGVSENVAAKLVRDHKPETIRRQLDCLANRAAKDAAAVLVSSIKGNWDAPPKYFERIEAAQRADNARAAQIQAEHAKARQNASERAQMAQHESEAAQLDTVFATLSQETKARLEKQAIERLGVLGRIGHCDGARQAMRRTLLKEMLDGQST